MSRSAGPGSPVYLMCPKLRRVWPRDNLDRDRHALRRTGRWRHRDNRRGALGVRSLLVEWEIVCLCGYSGWTRHLDVLQRQFVDGRKPPALCTAYHCGAPADECPFPHHGSRA
jgi:hypothetical protein